MNAICTELFPVRPETAPNVILYGDAPDVLASSATNWFPFKNVWRAGRWVPGAKKKPDAE